MRRYWLLCVAAGLACGCGGKVEPPERTPPDPVQEMSPEKSQGDEPGAKAAPVEAPAPASKTPATVAPPALPRKGSPGPEDEPKSMPASTHAVSSKPAPVIPPYGTVELLTDLLATNQVLLHEQYMGKVICVGGWVEKVLVENGVAYIALNRYGTTGVGGPLVVCRMKSMKGLSDLWPMQPLRVNGICKRVEGGNIMVEQSEVTWRYEGKK